MKYKTKYYLVKYKTTQDGSDIVYYKNMTQLEKAIKECMSLRTNSFDVRMCVKTFPKQVKNGWNVLPFEVDFDLWYYNHETDGVASYNLRDNNMKKTLLQKQRRLRKLMLSFNQ